MPEITAVEALKTYGPGPLTGMDSFQENLAAWIRDKEFSQSAVVSLAQRDATFGKIFQRGVMGDDRENDQEARFVANHAGRHIRKAVGKAKAATAYRGTREQNAKIDTAVSQGGRDGGTKFGAGACNRFIPYTVALNDQERKVSIAVIGYGAAGILAHRTLAAAGFRNVTVFEKSQMLGIWSRENVYGRSRNNPVHLRFGDYALEAAPGPGSHVRDFLNNFALTPIKANIHRIVPGKNFDHKVVFQKDGSKEPEEKTFAIVINCIGLGVPREADDDVHMATPANVTQCGERWQRTLSDLEAHRKHFTFIGLGNSTAEMLRQIHAMQDRGVDVDYRVMTHYPDEAVRNPNSTVTYKNSSYRIFRDTSEPNLTSWQGDLTESRYDYHRALNTGRLISGVKGWSRTNTHMVTSPASGITTAFKTDYLFTLIGYAQPKDAFERFGITTGRDKCANLDYDGEVQTASGSGRLHRGYFAFGAVSENPNNKNAIVLPGMLFRLHDIFTSITLRATEYVADHIKKDHGDIQRTPGIRN